MIRFWLGNASSSIRRIVGILGFGVFLLSAGPVWGCFLFPHEWTLIESEVATETCGFFGLTDAFMAWNAKRAAAASNPIRSIRLVRVFQGPLEQAIPATPELEERVKKALLQLFPAGEIVLASEAYPVGSDSWEILQGHPEWKENGFLEVFVTRNEQQGLFLLDMVYFNWVVVRSVFREETHLTLRLIDRQGGLIDLSEVKVSPTIQVDTMMGPPGCLLTYFEKNDHKPFLLDIGKLFPNVASGGFAIPPEAMRQPDLPSSLPMKPPVATASSEASGAP